jgi:hypothetical protein
VQSGRKIPPFREGNAASIFRFDPEKAASIFKSNPGDGFRVLTKVDVKITVFWDVTPCSLVESANGGEERAAFTFRFDLRFSERRL